MKKKMSNATHRRPRGKKVISRGNKDECIEMIGVLYFIALKAPQNLHNRQIISHSKNVANYIIFSFLH